MPSAEALPSHICPCCHVQYFAEGKCDWDGISLWPLEHRAYVPPKRIWPMIQDEP